MRLNSLLVEDPVQTQRASTRASLKRKSKLWTREEDMQLRLLTAHYGQNAWDDVSKNMVQRSATQCRKRWRCYASPDINKKPLTIEERGTIRQLFAAYGNQWALIARHLKNRTPMQVMNHVRSCVDINNVESKDTIVWEEPMLSVSSPPPPVILHEITDDMLPLVAFFGSWNDKCEKFVF